MSKIQLGVVRYVPDPVRDEPRNVGVVAWHAGKAVARFIGEDDVGALDRRRISSRLIPDRQTYGDWVQFWRSQLASGFVQDPVRQSKVAVASTDFLDALANVTRGGFEVRLGAETLVNKEWALDRVVQEAFDRLVHLEEWDDVVESEQAPKGKGHHRQLAYDACRALTKQRYRDKHDFVRDYEV